MPVVVCAVIKDNQILLLKRKPKGDCYDNLWSLPGGKIENTEHLSESAIREVLEETGIETNFESFVGTVSENLYENGEVRHHFLLQVVKLNPLTQDITKDIEGKVEWFDIESLWEYEADFIPSDFLIIKRMILNFEKNHFECKIRKDDVEYTLEKFE